MGVNSVRANKLWPLVPRILNKKEVNMFGQLLGVCSRGLIWLIQGHFMIFVSFRDLSVKGKKSMKTVQIMLFEDCVAPS